MTDTSTTGRLQPRRLGAWTLLGRLSVGGMSEVFAAVDDNHPPRRAALKRLLPHLGEDGRLVAQFLAEAHVLACIKAPQVTTILEVGPASDLPWIATLFVEGLDLHGFSRLASRAPTAPEIAALGYLGADALRAVHTALDPAGQPLRVIHRDVSPHNIMLNTNGMVQLIDFGIARFEGAAQTTQAGVIKGKHAYMSPEQVLNQPIDHRADLFAFGVVLWEFATGQRLFHRESLLDTLERVATATVPDPRTIRADLPAELVAPMLACLARDPAARPPDAATAAQMFATAYGSGAGIDTNDVAIHPSACHTIAAMLASEPAVRAAITSKSEVFSATPTPDSTPASPPPPPPSGRPGIETTHLGLGGLEDAIAAHLAAIRGRDPTCAPAPGAPPDPATPDTTPRARTHE